MNIIYTTADGMFRVLEEKGVYVPQERIVTVADFGRLRSEQEVQRFLASPVSKVHDNGWHGFHGGYQQFSIAYKGDKSFKTDKGAIKFVEQHSESLQEVA